MNQYRCETCDKDCVYANQTPTDELFYCQKFEYDWVRKFTSVKGCTTHSDFQSERDKVLPSGAVFDNTKRMVDEIRENERQQLIDKIFSGRKKIMKKKGIGFGEFLATETKLLASLRQKAGEP